jgi:hypothetical protein
MKSVNPSTFAAWENLDPVDLWDALRNREREFSGFPIGEWLDDSGGDLMLRVPDELADRHLPDRSNPAASNGQQARQGGMAQLQSIAAGYGPNGAAWASALSENATPVASNASAAYVAAQYSTAVKENPEILHWMLDAGVLLGSGGLALYATNEDTEHRSAKVAATSLLTYATWKIGQYLAEKGHRQMDAADRAQRAEIQQQRQSVQESKQQLPPKQQRTGMNGHQRRNGRAGATASRSATR